MKRFPTDHIGIDAQGGGRAVIEGLSDKDKIQEGETQLWPWINPEKEEPTDGYSGNHCVYPVEFANANWTSDANHGLRKDFEDRAILFPFFDPVSIELSAAQDKQHNRTFDTLEDCMMEIEELKNELSIITMTETPSGRDKWDTPEIKLPGNKKGRMRKDRYSALVVANSIARGIQRAPEARRYDMGGGWADDGNLKIDKNDAGYIGPAWFTEKMKDVY